MTQGDPIVVFAYGIDILLLIKQLKAGFPDVPQPWCADDVNVLGMFTNFELYFNLLEQFGLVCGYFTPNPLKAF